MCKSGRKSYKKSYKKSFGKRTKRHHKRHHRKMRKFGAFGSGDTSDLLNMQGPYGSSDSNWGLNGNSVSSMNY